MWKCWKKEILGISLACVLGIALITGLLLWTQGQEVGGDCKPHLMVEDTRYWLSSDYPEKQLPAGYVKFSEVESELPSGLVETNGQANGIRPGTPLYRSEAQPGWIYLRNAAGTWTRLTVAELQNHFLRWEGALYVDTLTADRDVSVGFDPKALMPTGEHIACIGAEIIPMEDCTANYEYCEGGEVWLDPQQPDILLVRLTRVRNGETEVSWHPFVAVDSLWLDYSAYEWKK